MIYLEKVHQEKLQFKKKTQLDNTRKCMVAEA